MPIEGATLPLHRHAPSLTGPSLRSVSDQVHEKSNSEHQARKARQYERISAGCRQLNTRGDRGQSVGPGPVYVDARTAQRELRGLRWRPAWYPVAALSRMYQHVMSSGHSRLTSSISRTSSSSPGTQNNSNAKTSSSALPAAASSSSAARIARASPANDLPISSSRSPIRQATMQTTATVDLPSLLLPTPAALSAASTVELGVRSSNLAASLIAILSKEASPASSSP
mmetsp:Transcript_25631/g.77858  ORF Transcript_25631/g.77858 Transcript_25631/m.77858 type:complete len:227 (-) Transcript_25631:372-1052(-)